MLVVFDGEQGTNSRFPAARREEGFPLLVSQLAILTFLYGRDRFSLRNLLRCPLCVERRL